MKKKILAAVVGLMLVAALAGAGTFAYFSDTETSSNNTFTAGTLDMALSNDGLFGGTDSVTGTWVSPANWAPGEEVSATLHFTNKGSVASPHIYFKFENLRPNGNGDGSNLANKIIVSELKERFNGVTTGNQAAYIDGQVGNRDGVLTLAEFAGFANGWYGYYTFDDQSRDGVVLGPNDQKDYDLILKLTFDPSAGNEYQGDTFSFDLTANATQNSPTDGLIKLHQ